MQMQTQLNRNQYKSLLNRQYEKERQTMNDWAKKDLDRDKALQEIYKASVKRISDDIDSYYMRYADRNGVSLKEAKKRADAMDVTEYFERARIAVQNKDFSPEAEEWLRVYNLKMSTSRLEVTKAKINLELLEMNSKIDGLITQELLNDQQDEIQRQKQIIAEYKAQAGILGNSVANPMERLEGVLNADFYGATFSERIWGRNGKYETIQKEVFASLNNLKVDMFGYRKERDRLIGRFNVSEFEAMRLLRTESQRVNMQVQHEMLVANDFTHYTYVAEAGACQECLALKGKTFSMNDYEMGVTAPLRHPNCRCSIYGHIEMEYKNGNKTTDTMDVTSKDEVLADDLGA